jgi:hypothetical protein
MQEIGCSARGDGGDAQTRRRAVGPPDAADRTHRDPDIRRRAIFWLGQSNDPRALALFEELLTAP